MNLAVFGQCLAEGGFEELALCRLDFVPEVQPLQRGDEWGMPQAERGRSDLQLQPGNLQAAPAPGNTLRESVCKQCHIRRLLQKVLYLTRQEMGSI